MRARYNWAVAVQVWNVYRTGITRVVHESTGEQLCLTDCQRQAGSLSPSLSLSPSSSLLGRRDGTGDGRFQQSNSQTTRRKLMPDGKFQILSGPTQHAVCRVPLIFISDPILLPFPEPTHAIAIRPTRQRTPPPGGRIVRRYCTLLYIVRVCMCVCMLHSMSSNNCYLKVPTSNNVLDFHQPSYLSPPLAHLLGITHVRHNVNEISWREKRPQQRSN